MPLLPAQRASLNILPRMSVNSCHRSGSVPRLATTGAAVSCSEVDRLQPSVTASQLGTKFPLFLNPESGETLPIRSISDFETKKWKYNAVRVHLAGQLDACVAFSDMLPGVEYGAVTALTPPKTVTVTDRTSGATSTHEIAHQQEFEQLQRDWNHLGRQGPFTAGEEWGHVPANDAESWNPNSVPISHHFSELRDGGAYYVEALGDWRHIRMDTSTGYLMSWPRHPNTAHTITAAHNQSCGDTCQVSGNLVSRICGHDGTQQYLSGSSGSLEKSKLDGFVITPTEFIVVEAQATAGREHVAMLASKASFIRENATWFKERFDVQIGSTHQLKCALVYVDVLEFNEMQFDAQQSFKDSVFCPGVMMFHT